MIEVQLKSGYVLSPYVKISSPLSLAHRILG